MRKRRLLVLRDGGQRGFDDVEAFRNQGIGRALVEAVIADARARGAGYLIVHPSQRAYPLYERLGFTATSGTLADAMLRQCKLHEAEVQVRRALALNPGYGEARTNLGRDLRSLGRLAACHSTSAASARSGCGCLPTRLPILTGQMFRRMGAS